MTAKKTPAINKTPTKAAAPKKGSARDVLIEVHSRGDTGKRQAISKRLEELEKIEQAKLKTVREWLLDVITIAKTYNRAKTAFREAKYQIIGKVYERYIQIESSGELRDQFYNELRKKLLEYGYKVQSNTPEAGLLLRLVLGKSPSSSSINSYVKVLYAAKESDIPQEKIVDWLRELTIVGAMKQLPKYEDIRKERVKRARVLLLNYLDWRETHPILRGRKPMLAHTANKYVTADTHLVVMLGTAVRRFDRESDYADIYISHIMPNNFDIDIKIIDRWARHIEPKLDFYEAEYNELPVEQWSALMEDELWGNDVAEAEKQSINWALRQQAVMYEDQQQFHKYAQAYKKQRAKFNKAVKKKS